MDDHAGTRGWKLAVDTGGTFTDCLAQDPAGLRTWVKVLSSGALRGAIAERLGDRRFRIEPSWAGPDGLTVGFAFRLLHGLHPPRRVLACSSREGTLELDGELPADATPGAPFEITSPEVAPLLAARVATGTPAGQPLPALSMRLATTRGTNALLTRTGDPPVLFVTRGFADLLAIGDQARPDLFALDVRKRPLLHDEVVEVEGRLGADGAELAPLDLQDLAGEAARLAGKGRRSAAVALLHADKNPDHESRVAAVLREAGFDHVSCSADLTPFIKILPRAETAVVNAYLAGVIEDYLDGIARHLGGGELLAMTSAGGLLGAAAYHAKDSLLSGPAGGMAGAARAGQEAGFQRLLTFDMGGTSTDVARFDGAFEYVFEHAVGDAHLRAVALAIESVAAGGGSICSFDGIRLKVGPESAGASPGPACYGSGGPLTLTDVNLLLGRIDAGRFGIPVLRSQAEGALKSVQADLAAAGEEKTGREALLEGFLELANQKMADAIRRISLRRGYDPRDYALVAFGGAGPQHALAVAERLDIGTVVIPPGPALLSAEGLAGAVVERFAEEQVLLPLGEVGPRLPRLWARLQEDASARLREEGVPDDEITIRRRIASLRYAGQDATLEIDFDETRSLGDLFEERYHKVFGHLPEGREIELVGLRLVASTRPDACAVPRDACPAREAESTGSAPAYVDGSWCQVPVFERDRLVAGMTIRGPALVFEPYSVVVLEPGWEASVHATDALVAKRRDTAGAPTRSPRPRPDAVRLELFTHRLETIARDMGEALRHTAISTNIKERLDYSCALLDPEGELLVNAPHIPVHLGSLGICVREVTRAIRLEPGDTVITNHPAFGGSHLPDVTLVSPVHTPEGRLAGYAVSRAHHAELGGVLPGSMPPDATRLADEGVVIPPMLLVRGGRADWDGVREVLTRGPYPTRALADNLADLRAALAANLSGVEALARLCEQVGLEATEALMQAMKNRAATKVQLAVSRLPNGSYTSGEVLDDGTPLKVEVDIQGPRAIVDFRGSADVHSGNLNATPAVVNSAVLYVLRLLIDEDLPLNEGLMRAVELRIPRGILNPGFPADPAEAPAVVGGNVETSQRLVNMLLRALKLCASSQGTMNNVTFGDETRSYYETVCGGCGAGPGFHGASAVHSHMTNTRITDPEVLEHRYPVLLERFAVRPGSGGKGRYHGGDGVVREIRFLEPLSLSILSQHRTRGPDGLTGGSPGMPGSQRILRADGREEVLGAVATCSVGPGDRLVLETPGGGGYGLAGNDRA